MPVPQIPGQEVDPRRAYELIGRVADLCHMESKRFPGGQPISFSKTDMTRLENEDFWVCEKSDGIRVLFFIQLVEGAHDVYLIDRKNKYYLQGGFFFPHYTNKTFPMRDTILDGELVLDTPPGSNHPVLRFLVFDALVIDEENIMQKTLTSRYGRLQDYFFKPYNAMLRDFRDMAMRAPFQLQLKQMQVAYGLSEVINQIPRLEHGTDGYIYTKVEAPYKAGTDDAILKWKPPHENSVDFKLELKFPELGDTGQPDLHAKPYFPLYVWEGGDRYRFYDMLSVGDDEWERMKRNKEQYDDRVIEARWDFEHQEWRFMRIRDDKSDANHIGVVENIIKTIIEPVHQKDLLDRGPLIRTRWKARAAAPRPPNPPPAHSQSHSHYPQQQGYQQFYPAPPYSHPTPRLPFPGAPYYQGGCVGVGFAKVSGPLVVGGWAR